jgi:hypothetical protein
MANHETVARIVAHERAETMGFVLGGSLIEGLAGAGAVVLAIIALASGGAQILMAITTIVVGGALMFQGGAIAARFRDLLEQTSNGALESIEFGAGMTAQVIGGIGVATLGILSLIGLSPAELVSVAAIVAGGTILLGSGTTSRINAIRIEGSDESEQARHLAHAAVASAAGTEMFIGIGAIALGILAVLNVAPSLLSIIAMLAVGSSVLLGGSTLTGLSFLARR